jgi:hypothetical protein
LDSESCDAVESGAKLESATGVAESDVELESATGLVESATDESWFAPTLLASETLADASV